MSENLLVDLEVTMPSSQLLKFTKLKTLTNDTRSVAEIFLDCAFTKRDELMGKLEEKTFSNIE